MSDLRYALRTLRKNRGFTALAVAILALGIGANTAIFSVVDTLLFRPPRFAHTERLVYLLDTNPGRVPADVEMSPSPGNVLDWRDRVPAFDAVAAWRNWYYALGGAATGHDQPESVRGVRVSGSFFSMIGVDAALGRTFDEREAAPGRDEVVILSDQVWLDVEAPTIVAKHFGIKYQRQKREGV